MGNFSFKLLLCIRTFNKRKSTNFFYRNKIKNPKANITSEEIEDLNTFLRANNAIVGDRYGSTFARINSAKRISKTTTTFDINS